MNELDSARFDPLLVKSVAKNVAAALNMLVARSDSLVGYPVSVFLILRLNFKLTVDRSR